MGSRIGEGDGFEEAVACVLGDFAAPALQETQAENERTLQTPERRFSKKDKDYMNAASRRYRAKKRGLRQQLQKRNAELEVEQLHFQTEIQSLRNQIKLLSNQQEITGLHDLKTENLILRAEIKRHKLFAKQLLSIVSQIPKRTFTDVQKKELLENGVESATSQFLRLLNLSVMDESWQSVSYTKELDYIEDFDLLARYQLLPFGSTWENAKSVNVRVDYFNIPDEIVELIKQYTMNLEASEQTKFLNFESETSKSYHVEDINLGDDGVLSSKSCPGLRVNKVTEKTEEEEKDFIMVNAVVERKLPQFGFLNVNKELLSQPNREYEERRFLKEDKTLDATIVINTHCPPDIVPDVDGTGSDSFEGHFLSGALYPREPVLDCPSYTWIGSFSTYTDQHGQKEIPKELLFSKVGNEYIPKIICDSYERMNVFMKYLIQKQEINKDTLLSKCEYQGSSSS